MPKFAYKARDVQDRLLTGSMDGGTVDDVLGKLEEKLLVPITVEELNFDGTLKNRSFWDKVNEGIMRMQNKVPYRAVVFFTRQLATMLEGGVPLAKALEQLGRNEKPVFKRIIAQVAEDISIGSTFSDAIARHPGAFNNMYVSVVRSGEISGALDTVLDQLATYMENVEAMKAKVKAAMRYPGAIAFFVTAILTGILVWLVPVFENLYSSFNATLPAPTLMLLAVSRALRENAPLTVGILIALIAGIKIALTNDTVRFFFHKYMLSIPVFGGIVRKNILAVYSRTMSLLMNSGTPILESTQIAGAVVNNKLYAQALEQVYGNLKKGELLSSALINTKVFPVLVTQLVSTGEESGKVDDLLRKAAEFYEREIRNTVDSLASIIEPFLIVILGGIVGSVLIALYMPVFMLGKMIK
ncbi:MAG: type II secretion system F family protein [Fibrobacterota bacterium]